MYLEAQNFDWRNFKTVYNGKVWQVARKFGEFGKLSVIRQTKTIRSSIVTINNPLADLFISQTFFHQTPERVNPPNILPT